MRPCCPFSVTVTTSSAGEKSVWVEARDGQGGALARGRTAARFARTGTPTATVRLARACEDTARCDDGQYCNGSESCDDGICGTGSGPCAGNVDCASSTCEELGRGAGICLVSVDHGKCATGYYCNPVNGCVQGKGCEEQEGCLDASQCNGQEQCVNLGCVGGAPPATDDGVVCTLDGCNETEGVFHVLQLSLDGVACPLDTGGEGICLAAKGGCVRSECGDGFRDELRQEECDDGNSDENDGCLSDCTLARCGDGEVQYAVEQCDDGQETAYCNSDCTLAACGDGKLNRAHGEQCDDGKNHDPCDGCLNGRS
jgi:cysteine-rich repeat protein